jgi:hypothetical protein
MFKKLLLVALLIFGSQISFAEDNDASEEAISAKTDTAVSATTNNAVSTTQKFHRFSRDCGKEHDDCKAAGKLHCQQSFNACEDQRSLSEN